MQHPKIRHVYIGLDVHRRTHTAVMVNCFNERLFEVTLQNKPSEFEQFLKEVKRNTPRGKSPIFALEDITSHGRPLAMFLLSKKQAVKYVNPNLTYSERKNQPILNKTDSVDAAAVAKVLLNSLDTLPDADPKDDYWILAQLVSRRRALVKASVALKNQIHNYIAIHYPSYKSVFPVFDSKTSLAFFEQYPSPCKLQGVGVEELGKFLSENSRGYYKESKAVEILQTIAKDGKTAVEYQDTRDFIVTTSVKQLKDHQAAVEQIEEELEKILPSFGQKLESMKGINTVMAAEFISQIGDINRFSSPDKLAKYSGLSPVSYSSGQTEKHFSNRRGDRKLHELFFMLAVTVVNKAGNKRIVNEAFYYYFKKKLSEGKTTKQALKSVMRRLCNILYWMMKNKTEYKELPSNGKE